MMMESTSMLVWGMFFGSIGLGFFMYGKKQKAIVPLLVGIALFIFPYFISDITLLVIVGAILVVLPYFVRI
jgi:predicted membrane protein